MQLEREGQHKHPSRAKVENASSHIHTPSKCWFNAVTTLHSEEVALKPVCHRTLLHPRSKQVPITSSLGRMSCRSDRYPGFTCCLHYFHSRITFLAIRESGTDWQCGKCM